ncbi:hypothetical protein ACFQ3B_18755 [Stackebrandtia endophytica]|nr:hypothetical protein [Stackebrandtia endophytica]
MGDDHRLLVTYNVNSFEPDDLHDEVDNYRPRYIDVHIRYPGHRPCG